MNDHQPPIEDLLNHATPQADPAFQHNLEEHLLARLHEKYNSQEENPNMIKMKRKHGASRSRLPLTLAAAIIAIVLVGGLIILLNRSSNSATFASPSLAPDNPFALTATHLVEQATEIAQCPQEDSGGIGIYTVQEGDTVEALATRFDLSVSQLVAANCLVPPDGLIVGQSLRIPNSLFDEPDQYELTATELIRTATEGASLQQGTPAIPTPDMYHLTATALIQAATQQDPFALQPTVLFTPTPAPMNSNDETGIPVMIAARDIAVGQIITAEMVYRVYWPRAVAGAAIEQNPDAGGLFGNWGDVIGRQAESFIPQWHPIHAEMIDSSATSIVLDEGMVAIAFSINQVTSSVLVHVGDTYDIFIACLEVQAPLATSEAGSIVNVGGSDCDFAINNAEILFVGKVDEAPAYVPLPSVDTAPTFIMITIGVQAEDVPRVAEAVNNGAIVSLQPSNTIP